MTFTYVSRAEWGATAWRPQRAMYSVPASERTEHLTHYHGAPPHAVRGVAVPREVEAIHLANGWAGIGYNWLTDLDGVIYEGRGWDLVGAHCPDHNRIGIGTYVAIGGDQEPTDAALAAVCRVYDEACRRAGRSLRRTWHGANYPTDCPGDHLRSWVAAGMRSPNLSPRTPQEATVPPPTTPPPTARQVADEILDTVLPDGTLGSDEHGLTFRWALTRMYHRVDELHALAFPAKAPATPKP